jgi:hypothetical protein
MGTPKRSTSRTIQPALALGKPKDSIGDRFTGLLGAYRCVIYRGASKGARRG